ncbi:MAG: hypothetical protein Q9219_005444 [cf. Caloplaca sp. 3 TL-2023]
MGKPPAVVIIARHGARLDAADKQWHLTSPTPYDPPLTYGGWVQSRYLGNRIGSFLHARSLQDERAPLNGSLKEGGAPGEYETKRGPSNTSNLNVEHGRDAKRKQKVIIHTSPFSRCIQTSIAIAAGIAQFEGSLTVNGHSLPTRPHTLHSEAQHPTHSNSPHLAGAENANVPQLSAIPEPGYTSSDSTVNKEHSEAQLKPCLRLDAFLGEWLSPEYFDLITPPPSSVMMLTSAKADLMRRGEYIDVPAGSYNNGQPKGNFPGGWGSDSSPVPNANSQHDSGPLSSTSSLVNSLPRMQRASSHSDINKVDGNESVSRIETPAYPKQTGYEPPTPSYAISPSDPIPPGYVAHARNACVSVDFQWDSMRQPHDWGHGGEYGEEWSAMHKRFRRGLQSMIAWYQYNHFSLSTQDIIDGSDPDLAIDEDNEDTDVILILVTHGAGCNALIGALTNQPVLLDVGMASLTMAVRKEKADEQFPTSLTAGRSSERGSMDSRVSDDYDMKMIASTEHLKGRSRASTLSLSHHSPSLTSSPAYTYRYRTSSIASTASSGSLNDVELKLESEIHGPASAGSGGSLASSSTFSGGLWTKPASKGVDGTNDRVQREKAPALNGHSPLMKGVSSDGKIDRNGFNNKEVSGKTENGAFGQPPTQQGMWGAPPTTKINEREKGFKRRWTHSER